MHLRIVHTTGYEYDGSISASMNEVRMTPQTQPGQHVTHTRLEVTPSPWTYAYRDYWGTQVTAFELFEPHESLTVVSSSTVLTDGVVPAPARLGRDEIAAQSDALDEFLTRSPLVTPPEDLAARLPALVADSPCPTDAAYALCRLVHDEMEYVAGSTTVQTTAATSWEQRSGVCQDIAHVVVGGLRTMGIPARYVSGYLLPRDDTIPGETVAAESHAWVEWWDGAWCGFDPTNANPAGERHVVIGTGRDYADVRPLSGIFSGTGTTSRMFVEVAITHLA